MDQKKLYEYKNNIVHSALSNFYVSNYKISMIHIKIMIGFSNVQELVSFSKIHLSRKHHLRENRRECSDSNVIFR